MKPLLTMSEDTLQRTAREPDRYGTHYEGCEAKHQLCAIRVLRAELDAQRAETPREPRACSCNIPDPVMQADNRFYCHACSFQTGARPKNLPEVDSARVRQEAIDQCIAAFRRRAFGKKGPNEDNAMKCLADFEALRDQPGARDTE